MSPTSTSRRGLLIASGFVFAAVLVGVIAVSARKRGFDWARFVVSVQTMDWRWLGLSLLCSYGTYLVRALRWAVLLKPLRPHPKFGKLFSATVIGFSAVTVLGRPAEMVRPYLIAARENVSFSSQIAAWVVERIYDVLIALSVFGFALSQVSDTGAYLGPALSFALRAGGAFIGGAASLCLALLLAMKYRSEHIQRAILRLLKFLSEHHLRRVSGVLAGFADGARCTRSVSAMFIIIGYTLMEWFLIAACYACVLRAFGGVGLSPTDVLVLMGFVSFGSLVQLPAVGGGAQVTAVLVLTEIFGVPVETATGLALLLWIISFMAILPVGVLLALHEGVTWARLREAGQGIAP